MEFDLDIDLDIDDLDFGDKVKEFFQHKLKEIKNINLSKKQKIEERKHLIKKLQAVSDDSKEKLCLVTWNWKKYFNNKFVICYTISSNEKTPLGNVKPILKWSSAKQLNYKYFIYGKNVINYCKHETDCRKITDELEKLYFVSSEAYIVAVIDDPIFLENLDCFIIGKLLIQRGKEEVLKDLPNVTISSEDSTNRDVCEVSLTTGKLDNVLAALSATEKTDLVLIFPEEWNITLDSTFEIHCSLTKMQLLCSCKTYFSANRLSQTFDNTILELHSTKSELLGAVCTSVYYSSKNAMFSFLHHIHRHVPGLVVIPKILYKHYKIRHCREETTSVVLQQFQDRVSKEIEAIESLVGTLGTNNTEYRSKLINLENETDVLYLKVCELHNIDSDC